MPTKPASAREAKARIVALLVAAKGRVDERELNALERLHAFGRLGVPRERFVQIAEDCVREIGAHLGETSWLRDDERAYIDRLLGAVAEPRERSLVCGLAAAAMAAGGEPTEGERIVYEHMLSSWRILAPVARQVH